MDIGWAGVVVAVAIALMVAGPVLDLVDVLEPFGALDGEAAHAPGVALAAGGMVATIAAQFAMGDAWRVGVDHSARTELMTSGPFLLVRNPISCGNDPRLLGHRAHGAERRVDRRGAAVGGSRRSTGAPRRGAPSPAGHGDEYSDYATRVGRFLPGVGRPSR